MGKLRVVLVRLIAALAFALACAGCLGALAGHGGRFSDELDIAAHFAPVQLWFALAGAGLMLLTPASRLRTATKWLAAAGAPLALMLLAPEMMRAQPSAAAASGAQVTLIQFNICGRCNRDLMATLDWLYAQNADVIVLEEVQPHVRAELERRGGYRLTSEAGRQTLILSRRPPLSSGLPPIPGGQTLSAARATLPGPGGPFTVVGAHYAWPVPAGLQQDQGRRLAAVLAAYPKARLILAGDFNSTPWSFTRQREDAAFGLERRTRLLFSWPTVATSRQIAAPVPLLPIDHVYAGSGWRTVSVERGPRLGSDHYPVIVKLAPASGQPPPGAPGLAAEPEFARGTPVVRRLGREEPAADRRL